MRRSWRPAVMVGLVVYLIIGLLAGCSAPQADRPDEPAEVPAGEGPGPNDDYVFCYSRGVELETWSPYGDSSTPGYDLWRNVMEPLVDYDWKAMRYVPVLAESWEYEDGGRTWVFHLRKGVRFHDGAELTAADVIHSFTRMRDDENSMQAEAWQDVKEIEARDEYTVAFHLEVPRPDLNSQLYNRYITSKSAYDQHGPGEADRHPSGTGPYRFVEWERGSYIALTRFDDYWDTSLIRPIKDIVYRPIPEKATAIAGLEAGEVDLVDNIPPHEVERLQGKDGVRVESAPSGRLMFFLLNPAHEPLDDVRVRKAIQRSLDIDLIIETVLEGRAYREWQPVPEGAFGHNPALQPYEYDPDMARDLLEEAGYSGGSEIALWTPTSRYTGDLETSQAAGRMMQEAGIKVKVEAPEWGIFVDNFMKGQIPIVLIGRGGFLNDPPRYLSQYFETGVTNRLLYSNPEVDGLLQGARSEMDEARRRALVEEAVALIHHDAVQVPLYRLQDNYGVREWVDWTANPSEYVHAYRVGVRGE